MYEYAERFRQLDALDFKIIKGMYKHGFSNLSKLAESIGVPKQTVSYHSRKLERQDVVRFRALIDESKLGLKSFAVVASTQLGKESISSRAMTCFPLWRYLALVDGWKRGNFVRYAVPADKERDLEMFLRVIKGRNLIQDFSMVQTTGPSYPLLNMSFYVHKKEAAIFEWDKWLSDFDKFPDGDLSEPANYELEKIDLYDLLILRCLEINARTSQRKIVKEMARIVGEKDPAKFIPLVSRRIRETITPRNLIRGYRAYLFPNPVPTTMVLMYHVIFSKDSSLKKLVAALGYLPYNTGYEKVLGKDELFVRFIVPVHEFPSIWTSMTQLAEKGHAKDAHLMISSLARRTWDNVEIYQMFKGETWNFSYGIAAEMLEKSLSG
jgi:DNA-binding Lrp family transcriptional regulator